MDAKEKYKPPSPESHPREWPNASPAHLEEVSCEGEAGEEEASTGDTEVELATPHADHAEKSDHRNTLRPRSNQAVQPSQSSAPQTTRQPPAGLGEGSPAGKTPSKDDNGTFKARSTMSMKDPNNKGTPES